MAELMDHVEALADQIGPRPVSTEEERQAALYIAQELTDLGLEVNVDEFATPTGVRWPYVIAFAAIVLGTVLSGLGMFVEALSTPMFVLGLLLAVAGFGIYYTERANMSFLSRTRAGGVSQNVVAKYVPSSVARERSRRKVIIAAHVDTVRAEPQAAPVLVNRYPLIRTVLFYCMAALVALLFIRLLPIPWPEAIDMALWVISLIGCVLVLACLACIVANRFMPYVSGGNDNASAAAVMLGVAKRLLDPAERERWTREQHEVNVDVPVETLAPQSTGSFSAVVPDNVIQLHSAEEAEDAGLVPEGAEISYEYEDAAAQDDGFTVPDFDELEAAEAAEEPDVLAEVIEFDAFAKGAEDEDVEDEAVASEEEAFEAEADAGEGSESAAAAQEAPEIPQDTENVPLGGAWPTAEDYTEEEEEPQDSFVPEFLREPEDESVPSVPSWYTAAREKAAKERAAKEADEQQAEAAATQPAPIRSRFADMPLASETARVAEPVEEAAEEPAEEVPAKPRRRLVDLHTGEDIVEDDEDIVEDDEASAQPEQAEPAEQESPAAGAEAQPEQSAPAQAEPFSFDFEDEEIDDISPDLTGSFAPVDSTRADQRQRLTSRIPAIGDSDGETLKREPAETAPAEEKPKADVCKPTARRVTEEFQPTRVADEREEIELGSSRQAAAVSSSYSDTPQATPRKTEEPAARTMSQRPVPRAAQPALSGTMPAVRTSAQDNHSRPGNTSSFPALTGSFPALTGTIPTVSSDDFATPSGGDFLAPSGEFSTANLAMTGTIDIPDSAFHNAVENVGGLFSKLGRKGKNTKREDFEGGDEGWNEEDDFGWKGGGYFSDDSGLGDAARRRAAEIRESVISMTESDLLDKEVWFVALGASNANGQGMKNFLDLHQGELRGSLIINLEGVGSGDISYVDFEGTGTPCRADRRLVNLVKKASRAISGKEMKAQSLTWRNTDATFAMLSGMRAISIMGFDGAAPEGWHWSTDTADVVNPEKLEYVSKLLMKIIENS